MKIQMCRGQKTWSKTDEINSLAIPNRISTISMHIPSLVKIHWYLLKLSSRNESMYVSRADNCQNLTKFAHWQSQTNINAHTKFGEKPTNFTQVIIQKQRYGQKNQKDRHTDHQRDTIIPHHYCEGHIKILYFSLKNGIKRNGYPFMSNNS